ncbi:MAG: hypothetical protein COV31_01155 [Candidatus Yanofskybacteria bacterium CG10_big_fil_rev_8_21_14_0_10_46_23]|uniref:Transglycosylase SLT domain-containing protein n=1 Tax=Candidatus Yanofskybacteria bacterium CG10_big_fil_rev_8_21_14_0_10_46_23 TaxID=1975098 RepID=A0A2H0R6L0_9BACT|nr:MAG: hypothetical protein COV31_01155 [Candidatus Yanofskybacteria bacterium CG10_big_fil_rev_8_21_14_0_10_46_23]
MKKRPQKIILTVLFVLGLIFSGLTPGFSLADESLDAIKAREAEIQRLQEQIQALQGQIDAKQGVARTLENEISRLNAQISKVQLGIQQIQLSIDGVNGDIVGINRKIQDGQTTMATHKEALSEIIRVINQQDSENLTEIVLKNDSISDFFSNLHAIKTTQNSLKISIDRIRQIQAELEEDQAILQDRRGELEQLQTFQEIERQAIASARGTKDKILSQTRGEEARFQDLVQQSKRNIEALRAEIQFLVQSGITAEDAVKYAELAALRVGIRPAFLLALLDTESRLGANVGKCVIVDQTSGTTRHVTTGQISQRGIHPTRDLPVFLQITNELGLDPGQTPVSCNPYGTAGWGGAMGPAQFIPSTWLGYREAVSKITGRTPANPWNFEDAFIASALYLARRGAAAQTRETEIAAAKAYISGSPTCSSSICNYYANAILQKAAQIEPTL